MQTTEYHLYRVKFIKPAQINLFHPDISPKQLFENGLAERPSIQIRNSNVWHIGNVEQITLSGGRFAVGRTTITTIEKFDPKTGDFTEQKDDSGPYTFVYFDSRLGLLAIGKRTKVASNVGSIARKLQKLFSSTEGVLHNRVEVRVDYIPDPESFLQKLHSAYAIKKFTAHFTGPNPIDADELFQRPLSYYCQQLNGEKGVVVVKGQSLNESAVAAVAKSTAATANSASALIQTERGTRPIPISLGGNARKVLVEEDADKHHILQTVQDAYKQVRE
ncbi:MAG TPA: hypothetical protein VFF81_03280 [Noviherbaspirillum sp.]|nr:hypothetical protein [Noviherbaspirillum sp.]